MDKYIVREVTPDELDGMKIATMEIRYMETHDKVLTSWYKLCQKKGDTYRKFKLFPKPHFEIKEYEENIATGLTVFNSDELYTEADMNEMGYIIEDGVIYCKPYIIICYGPDKKLEIKYESTDAMMRAWEHLRYRFEKLGLHFIF